MVFRGLDVQPLGELTAGLLSTLVSSLASSKTSWSAGQGLLWVRAFLSLDVDVGRVYLVTICIVC